ncbi:hypothetical protein CEN47_25865, partial [Fischerella thermalis CCMEE 5319]
MCPGFKMGYTRWCVGRSGLFLSRFSGRVSGSFEYKRIWREVHMLIGPGIEDFTLCMKIFLIADLGLWSFDGKRSLLCASVRDAEGARKGGAKHG